MTTTCRRCGRPKPPLAIQHGDLFCSTVCSKAAHGVKDTWVGDPRRVKYAKAQSTAVLIVTHAFDRLRRTIREP